MDNTPGDKLGVWRDMRLADALVFMYCLLPTEKVNAIAGVCLSACLPVCLLARLLKNVWIWMKFCVSTDIGTWTNWLTFEPDPDHSPDSGTGFISRISCTLQNFAALLSLAYFSAISVSFCAKLARSILMRDRNTATEPDFRQSLSIFVAEKQLVDDFGRA